MALQIVEENKFSVVANHLGPISFPLSFNAIDHSIGILDSNGVYSCLTRSLWICCNGADLGIPLNRTALPP